MSQTALERRAFHVPMRWPCAGGDPSRSGHCARPAVRSLTRFKRLLRGLLYASNLCSGLIRRPHAVGVTSTLQPGAAIKSP